jgi:hypothetical protein
MKDPHYNAHRAGKRRFEVCLKPDESALIDEGKAVTKQVTNKGLLLELCRRLSK